MSSPSIGPASAVALAAGTEAGAPEPEIEITPAMVEAGAEALASVNLEFEMIEEAAIRIYCAMERARAGDRSAARRPGGRSAS
jgi:hypothetical protein